MRSVIIFRGEGRISAADKEKCDTRVDVFFKENAWMDDAECIAWAKRNSFEASRISSEGRRSAGAVNPFLGQAAYPDDGR